MPGQTSAIVIVSRNLILFVTVFTIKPLLRKMLNIIMEKYSFAHVSLHIPATIPYGINAACGIGIDANYEICKHLYT